jgi:hypothetical protein
MIPHTEHQKHLTQALDGLGVTIQASDISEIVTAGIDNYLTRRNYMFQVKQDFSGLYIILNELKSSPLPSNNF